MKDGTEPAARHPQVSLGLCKQFSTPHGARLDDFTTQRSTAAESREPQPLLTDPAGDQHNPALANRAWSQKGSYGLVKQPHFHRKLRHGG